MYVYISYDSHKVRYAIEGYGIISVLSRGCSAAALGVPMQLGDNPQATASHTA